MRQLIYTKYSNERNRQFALRTDIFCDEEGNRSVRKTALSKEGEPHIRHIAQMEEALGGIYAGSRLTPNHGTLQEDGLWLEYVQQHTLEERLDSLLLGGKTAKAWKLLSDYLAEIRTYSSKEPFAVTERFTQVFGVTQVPGEHRSAPVSNIDLVCSNILLCEPQWVMIDYEWTFPFPIPVEYLLYRVIHYYIDTQKKREVLRQYEPYEWAGITEEQRLVYQEMERSFQSFITHGHIPMREMYGDISPGVYPVSHLVQKEATKRSQGHLQIYYSVGAGFTQENSCRYEMKGGQISLRFAIPEGTDEIRLDPGDAPGICRFHKLGYDRGEVRMTGWADGISKLADGYLMNCFDPCFYLGKVPDEARYLEVELSVQMIDPEDAAYCGANREQMQQDGERIRALEGQAAGNRRLAEQQQAQLAEQREALESLRTKLQSREEELARQQELLEGQQAQLQSRQEEIERLTRVQQEQNRVLAEQAQLIENMRNTKVWKMYAKYRAIVERK